MTKVSLTIPESLATDIATAATQRGVSKSELVRQAIQSFLSTDAVAERPDSASASFADLVGAFSGPADLSVNKTYLDDLGRQL